MLITFLVFAALSLLALLVLLWCFLPTSKAATTIPGINITNDMQGNLNNIAAAGSLSKFLTLLHCEHGPIASFWYGEFLTISLGTATLIKQVKKLFPSSPGLFQSLVPVMGDPSQSCGVFLHKVLSQIQPFSFSGNHVREKVGLLTKEICMVWSGLSEDDQIPALDYMTALAVKIVATTQMGDYFKEEVNIASFNKSYNNVMVDLEAKMTEVVHWEKNDPREMAFRKKIETFEDIIRKCAKMRDTLGESDDDDEAVATLASFALTEISTIGFMLTWILYYLSIYPELQEKVRSEQNYIEKVFKEVVRISQFIPFASRVQHEREMVLEGHLIEPGTLVMLSSATALMDPDVYDDPHIFNPDRDFPSLDPVSLLLPDSAGAKPAWSRRVVVEVIQQILQSFNIVAADPDMRCGAKFCPFAKPDTDIWLKPTKL